MNTPEDEKDFKEKFKILTNKTIAGETQGEEIFTMQKKFLKRWLDKNDDNLKHIKETILKIKNTAND